MKHLPTNINELIEDKIRNRGPIDLQEVTEAEKASAKDLLDKFGSHRLGPAKYHKFDLDKQLELMELIARWSTLEEINEYFVRNHKIVVSPSLYRQYKYTQKWKPVIKKFREKYLLNTEDVPGSHKRVRLDRADRIYSKAYSQNNLKIALQANRDSHEMTEGRHANQGDVNMTFNQYNVLDDEELKIRIKEAQDKLARRTIDVQTNKEITA